MDCLTCGGLKKEKEPIKEFFMGSIFEDT